MFSYSVAIRTLGKAGSKYQETLDSIAHQSLKPTSIYVYIPYNYALPEETIGIEKYIRCDKGMVSQRAQKYEHINDEWILFLDDDIFLPTDYIERAVAFIEKTRVDVLVSQVFSEGKTLNSAIVSALNFVFPMISRAWGLRVSFCGRYFYNVKPQFDIMKTNTGAGACSLCRKSVYLDSKFEDERWMDDFGYALGDDQLFHYKMYLNGAKEYVWFNSGVVHLDAGAQSRSFDNNYIRKSSACLLLVWYRSIYEPNNGIKRLLAIICFTLSLMSRFLFSFSYILRGLFLAPMAVLLGTFDAIKFMNSASYKSYRKFC